MLSAFVYMLLSVIIVSLISVVAIFGLTLSNKFLKKALIWLVSLSAGALIGDAFLHLIPEAAEAGFTLMTSLAILAGLVVFFIIESFIHWHHCHGHECDSPSHSHKKPRPLVWTNLIGDGVHNLIDGLVIAASYVVSIPLGIATTIAVIFHEIPQEVADFGVLLHGGLSKKKAIFYNFLSATLAIIGGVVGFFMSRTDGLISFLVPFAAGGFVYIAAADLIPELHRAENQTLGRRIGQVIGFVLGIAIMVVLLLLE